MKNMDKRICSFLVPATILLGATACSPDITTYCQDIIDCYDGNEYDEDACVADTKSDRKVADAYGCQTEFDDMMTCIADNGRCEYSSNSGSGSGSGSEYGYNNNNYTTDELCDTQYSNYYSCMEAADPGW